MAAQSASIGAHYLHALQPSQYLSGNKELTAKEWARAYRAPSPWSEAMSRGYPLLQERGASLRARGVDFVDLTESFRGMSDTIYRDICCHMVTRGYQILGRRIGVRLAQALEAAPGYSP